jgi:hypothetical protein
MDSHQAAKQNFYEYGYQAVLGCKNKMPTPAYDRF